MTKEGVFWVFCIEMYRVSKRMTGKQVIELFKHYGVSEYLISCYEALHTTGQQYIVEDIDLFIESRQSA